MYKLYTIPGSCSTGIHILLNTLGQSVEIIEKNEVDDFSKINPLGSVPVLDDGGTLVKEGAAVALYLLEKHASTTLPKNFAEKSVFLQKFSFNYSTMHPAYNRLFFAMRNYEGSTQTQAYAAAATAINKLWKVVDAQLESSPFVSGEDVTIIDYMLCIYANWGTFFEVDIQLGENVERMIKAVATRPEFTSAFEKEGATFNLFNN